MYDSNKMNYFLVIVAMLFFMGCGDEDTSDPNPETTTITPPDTTTQDTNNNTDDTNNNDSFVFDTNLVMEHSWNTGGCTPGPCSTISTSLSDVFENGQPDDPYFYRAENGVDLILHCQPQKGRRTEFKQISEGSLNTPSLMEFEAVYFDVPEEGMTIAQVHNRGGNSNKPFFRLELHNDELETVVRQDPEVNSSDTSFDKEFYSFDNGANYNGEPIKILIEKNDGVVHLVAEHNGVVLIDQTYAPNTETNWVLNNSIANGYYLKAGIYNPAEDHTEDIIMQYTSFLFESEDN